MVFATIAAACLQGARIAQAMSNPEEFVRVIFMSGLLGAAVGAPFRRAGYAGTLVALGVFFGTAFATGIWQISTMNDF